jgi:maltose O-acetyltransferase
VWLGGGVIVCPGVTIGADTVVGAGSVVTRDLPAGVVAVGSPARVLREL